MLFRSEGIELVPNEGDTYRVTTYGVLEYQITDTEINLTSSGSLLLAVDTEEPSCEDDNIQYSAKDWTNQDVTVQIQAKDDLAKTITYLKKVEDEDGNVKYEEDAVGHTFVFTENREHTFYFKDEAGNVGSKTVSVDWIDKKKPEAKAIFTTDDGKAYDPDHWTNQDVAVRLEFDSISPVTMPEKDITHLLDRKSTRLNSSHTS